MGQTATEQLLEQTLTVESSFKEVLASAAACKAGNLAPVAVYTYTRLEHFKQTVAALRRNYLAPQTVLYVVSDGPKHAKDAEMVNAIRAVTDDLDGFREIVRIYRDQNLGVGKSPLLAEQQIISDHGKIISMEDDNVTSDNYLSFINQGLNYFADDDSVFSICGYMPPVFKKRKPQGDFWFYHWQLSWGYGTWKKQYDRVYPLINVYDRLKRDGTIRQMNQQGGLYVTDSMRRDYFNQGKFLDSVLAGNMTLLGMRAVIPTVSKVMNVGVDGSGASAVKNTDRYLVELDTSGIQEFDFSHPSHDFAQLLSKTTEFFNEFWLTRLARRLGVYHEALQAKNRLLSLVRR